MSSPTIRDVAQRAGVSPAAVSLVLNDKAAGRLGGETIARVREAIDALSYMPNGLARRVGLRKNGPVTMGIGYLGADLTNTFHGVVINAAVQEMRRDGYHLILASPFRTGEEAREILRRLHGLAADGWLLTSIIPREVIDFVVRAGITAVFAGSGTDVEGLLPQVRGDDFRGAYQATRHLLELGHRRIAFLGAYSEAAFTRWRCDGYRMALHDAGLPAPAANVWTAAGEGNPSEYLPQRMAGAEPPTALVVSSEQLALDALWALGALGYKVPDDVSVVAYDTTGLGERADPPLTSIVTPREELGALAFRRLHELLAEPERRTAFPQMILPARLAVRGSTAPLRQES